MIILNYGTKVTVNEKGHIILYKSAGGNKIDMILMMIYICETQ